jgi:hypothetical protein
MGTENIQTFPEKITGPHPASKREEGEEKGRRSEKGGGCEWL